MKTIIFALALLCTPCSASAVTMNISDLAGFSISGATGIFGNGYTYVSPIYLLDPGTTVDFGTAFVVGDYSDGRDPCHFLHTQCFAETGAYQPYFITDGARDLFGSPPNEGGGFCPVESCVPTVFRLLLTLGPDHDGVQLTFRGISLIIDPPAPVPLPAALPLFAAGLGIVTFLARRKKTAAARPA